jgi:hypothetical protein
LAIAETLEIFVIINSTFSLKGKNLMKDSLSKKLTDSTAPNDDTTTGSGGSSTYAAIGYLPGFSDTQISAGILALEGSADILTKVSLVEMGNLERQARKGKERVVYDQFGEESTKQAVKENLANSEKSPQHRLGNVLGLTNAPRPRGP